FCFMAAVLYLFILGGYDAMFIMATGFHKINSMAILSVLFFILMGGLMGSAGIAKRLVAISDSILGRAKSGLGTVSIISCAIFGAISGTCTAAVAGVGAIMIPRMVERGYPRGHATGLIACASVLGQLIPPSVPMILYAWVTWQSVAACFLATVVPGILLVILYSIINWVMCRNLDIKVTPALPIAKQIRNFGKSTYQGTFALLMPIIVLGGIYGGVFTPTESAGIAVLYCIIVGFLIYHTLDIKQLISTMVNSITTTGVVVLMVFFVMILSRLFIMINVPQRLVAALTGVTDNKYLLLLMVNLFLIILGMLMDDFSATLLAAPLLFPLMEAIGIHPVHFAAILGTNLGLGNVTPPTAPILYLAGRVGNSKFDEMITPALIFMFFGAIPIVLLTTYFPFLSLALPHWIMPKLVSVAPWTLSGY
ncbi:MAG: TRAP transporter large permease, partial [Candidatus Atribacteria bacterium]|nr:TRAP transporter large permease [Candidatus Atribacteria bacterium]